jgi:hypothetical protein
MKEGGANIRQWIEAGYRNYGSDPWFFIRELAQNSRDAGAAIINVETGYTPAGEETLVFTDDGSGMSYQQAVRYLFRLYASSKTGEKHAAGLFGIGFWTVLKFNPHKIIIESRCRSESWAVMVEVGKDLVTTSIPVHLKQRGTRITLIRRACEESARALRRKTKAALERYCSYLRRNTRKAEPLPVLFAGENITTEMKLPGPVSMSFKRGGLEGAVGLGSQPHVRLYANGLPVWEGTTLEELSHTPPIPADEKAQTPEMVAGHGLAPVFLLNGSGLEVNISRRRVIDNRHLQRVRLAAEQALARMVETAVDCISPRGLLQRLTHRIKRGTAPIFHSFTKTLLLSLLILLPLEYLLVRSFYKPPPGKTSGAAVSLLVEDRYYSGASVRTAASGKPLQLRYDPPGSTWFKLFSADVYRTSSGFMQAVTPMEKIPPPPLSCRESTITVEIQNRETGKIFLPLPAGYGIDVKNLRLNNNPLAGAKYHDNGEVVVSVSSAGVIRYRCCPLQAPGIPGLSPEQRKKFTALPGNLVLSDPLEKTLTRSSTSSMKRKVETALSLTAGLLTYDASRETARKYAQSSNQADWFQKVIHIGTGDCDILNGVSALFLRRMGVPAQLVIGLVGQGGRVLAGMHAWTEYFEDARGWQVVDVTAYIRQRQLSRHPSPSPAAGSPQGFAEPPGGERSSTGKQGLSRLWFLYTLAGGLLLVLSLLFFLLFRLRRSQTRRLMESPQLRQVREDLAGMLLHELLHPGTWGRVSGLRDFKLIPTIDGKHGPVSLRQALERGSRGKLYTLNPDTFSHKGGDSLAAGLKRAAVPILDTGNAAFAPLINILPGAIHLERIFNLNPVIADESGLQPLQRLVAAVNRQLQTIEKKIPPCLLAPGLGAEEFYDVDLAALPSLQPWGIPNRFIALNPDSPRIRDLDSLFQTNPHLAQFRLIAAILEESNLILYPRAVLARVSRQLTGRWSP